MRVELKPYSLAYRSQPKSVSQSATVEGVLIRLINDDKTIGYSSLQTWPLLGDPSLETCVKDLLECNLENNLVRKSLAWARSDGVARKKGITLFDGLQVPKSHFLFTSTGEISSERLEALASQGFSKFKIKMGSQLETETRELREVLKDLSPDPNFRLDLNGSLSSDQIQDWLDKNKDLFPYIDFIEDPCPFEADVWRKLKGEYGIRLALDWDCEEIVRDHMTSQLDFFDVLVLKPANCGCAELLSQIGNKSIQYMVTSYLDHPIGQSFAAWEAARLAIRFPGLVDCGLLTHQNFMENDPFIAATSSTGALLDSQPDDPGIGYTSLLESEFGSGY